MKKHEYNNIETFMISKMSDSAHDIHHVYRVLNATVDIANYEENIDMDVLIAAALLHDIGREAQFENPSVCHAQHGGEIAYDFLKLQHWAEEKAFHVKQCIQQHRYRSDNPPESIEAKILFDADKLDVTGAIGIARTLQYEGHTAAPLYTLDENNKIITETSDKNSTSFFQEYNFKLKKVYDVFFTEYARKIAIIRQQAMMDFYNNLYAEINQNYENGMCRLYM
ncbi:MAG: HD domain-containing protein [Defluviitaleaceae bacterium]|nr:HD domain-containing protein [Defluviitaleaceae bacterium]